MTDRELLELAAKAAGIEYNPERSKPHPISGAFFGLWLVFHDEPSEYARRYFNPLRDDGDALRLAVKLGFDVCIDTRIERNPDTQVIGFIGDGADTFDVIESHGDPYAATRRAIVRAAAALAKQEVKR